MPLSYRLLMVLPLAALLGACSTSVPSTEPSGSVLTETACTEVSPHAPVDPERCWILTGTFEDARAASNRLVADAGFVSAYTALGFDAVGEPVCDELEPPDSPLVDIDTMCFLDLMRNDESHTAYVVVTRPFVDGDTERLLRGEPLGGFTAELVIG